jgi:hypothetical protein
MKYGNFAVFEGCCGLRQMGVWREDSDPYGAPMENAPHPKGTENQSGYTGIFTATFNKSEKNLRAEADLKASGHTLLYESEYYSNLSRYAEPIGRERGVKICVFLHKDAAGPVQEKTA